MERTVLEESWRWNGPAGPSLEVIDMMMMMIMIILRIIRKPYIQSVGRIQVTEC
jgi:hypothetical protein